VSEETSTILAIAADRFLTHRHGKARDVYTAIGRGEDPRVSAHVMAVREGFLIDVELPYPDIYESATYVAALLQAEHVIGLQEHLAVPPSEERRLVVPTADDIVVRLWAGESWIDGRIQSHLSEPYASFPRAVRWLPEPAALPETTQQFIDPVCAYSYREVSFSEARSQLRRDGCVVTHLELDQALDRWTAEFGHSDTWDIGPELGRPFGPSDE
jgi:hypothetical protein